MEKVSKELDTKSNDTELLTFLQKQDERQATMYAQIVAAMTANVTAMAAIAESFKSRNA